MPIDSFQYQEVLKRLELNRQATIRRRRKKRRFRHTKKQAQGAGLTDNLVEFWDLDDGDANQGADHASYTLTKGGTLTNGATSAPDGGAALEFSTGAASLTNGAFPVSLPFTIAGWFDKANGTIFEITDGATTQRFKMLFGGGTFGLYHPGGLAIPAAPSAGWHSFAVTYDQTDGTELFIDGASSFTDANTSYAGDVSGGVFVGANQSLGDPYASHLVSFGVWNERWDATKASTWHNSGVNLRYAGL